MILAGLNNAQTGIRIGLMDSGIGGLATAHALSKLIQEKEYGDVLSIVFIGDAAEFPYGEKHSGDIVAVTDRVLSYLINELGCAIGGAACNTASVNIGPRLDEMKGNDLARAAFMNQPGGYAPEVIHTIQAVTIHAIKAEFAKKPGSIAYVATQATVNNRVYTHAFEETAGEDHKVSAHPAPGLVNVMEQHGVFSQPVKEQVAAICDEIRREHGPDGPERIAMLCTHYEFVADQFQAAFPNSEIVCQGRIFAERILDSILNSEQERIAAMREANPARKANGVVPIDIFVTQAIPGQSKERDRFAETIKVMFDPPKINEKSIQFADEYAPLLRAGGNIGEVHIGRRSCPGWTPAPELPRPPPELDAGCLVL